MRHRPVSHRLASREDPSVAPHPRTLPVIDVNGILRRVCKRFNDGQGCPPDPTMGCVHQQVHLCDVRIGLLQVCGSEAHTRRSHASIQPRNVWSYVPQADGFADACALRDRTVANISPPHPVGT